MPKVQSTGTYSSRTVHGLFALCALRYIYELKTLIHVQQLEQGGQHSLASSLRRINIQSRRFIATT